MIGRKQNIKNPLRKKLILFCSLICTYDSRNTRLGIINSLRNMSLTILLKLYQVVNSIIRFFYCRINGEMLLMWWTRQKWTSCCLDMRNGWWHATGNSFSDRYMGRYVFLSHRVVRGEFWTDLRDVVIGEDNHAYYSNREARPMLPNSEDDAYYSNGFPC